MLCLSKWQMMVKLRNGFLAELKSRALPENPVPNMKLRI
jgi:hypothetical protein